MAKIKHHSLTGRITPDLMHDAFRREPVAEFLHRLAKFGAIFSKFRFNSVGLFAHAAASFIVRASLRRFSRVFLGKKTSGLNASLPDFMTA